MTNEDPSAVAGGGGRTPRQGSGGAPVKRLASMDELIREAAARLFMSEGFERTSMDGIANAAGVSKQTIYSHFNNKDELFRGCVMTKTQEYELLVDAEQYPVLDDGLRAMADGYLRLMSDDTAVAMWRLMVGEANIHPNVAKMFHETGPGASRGSLTAYLQRHDDELEIDNYAEAASMFISLVAGQFQNDIMLGVRNGVSDKERDVTANRAIRQFRRLYGRNGA